MTTDSPRCQNPACDKPITIVRGHRARKYCNDNCKQAAYLARLDAAERARKAAEEAEKLRLEMEALTRRWGDLLPETLQQLKWLKDRNGIAVADQMVATIKGEMAQQTHHDQQQQPGADLEEERAKYKALLADYMQSAKKIGYLERQVQRVEHMGILKSRESMFHELMLLGGRLKYASMTDLGIDQGIDQWLNYIRGASDEQLTIAIAHGFYQADQLAMATIEASDMKLGIEMRRRINDLEREVVLRDARIAELEYGQGQKVGDELHRDQIERLEQKIADLEREVGRRITEIGRMKEAHSSTMYNMNNLLAAAQSSAKHDEGAETQRIAELEREIEHLNKRISKQYERRIAKQQARIEELESVIKKQSLEPKLEKTPAENDCGTRVARLMALAERLHYCRLLIPHINPGIESWQSFIETASSEQINQAVETAEHYYGSLIYLDELDQHTRQEARERKAS